MTKQIPIAMRANFDFLYRKKDARIWILGADGSGKTVLMHYLAEEYHKKGVPIKFLAPTKILTQKHLLPEWMEKQNWKWPKFDENKIHLIDDAQFRAYGREFYKSANIRYAKIMTVARHLHAGVILTTQQGSDLDIKVLQKGHIIIFKKPSYLGSMFERPELRRLESDVLQLFETEIDQKGLDYQQYAYVFSDYYRGFVGPTGTPSYWTKELGDW